MNVFKKKVCSKCKKGMGLWERFVTQDSFIFPDVCTKCLKTSLSEFVSEVNFYLDFAKLREPKSDKVK